LKLSILDQSPIISGHNRRAGGWRKQSSSRRPCGKARLPSLLACGSTTRWQALRRSFVPKYSLPARGFRNFDHPRRHRRHPAAVLQSVQGGRAVPACSKPCFPRRIDLGVGRAPGGDQTTAMGDERRQLTRPPTTFPSRCSISSPISTMPCRWDIRLPKVKAQPMGADRAPQCGCSVHPTIAAPLAGGARSAVRVRALHQRRRRRPRDARLQAQIPAFVARKPSRTRC